MPTTLYTLAALYLLAALYIVAALNILAALYGTTTTVLRVHLLAGVMLVAVECSVVGSSAEVSRPAAVLDVPASSSYLMTQCLNYVPA